VKGKKKKGTKSHYGAGIEEKEGKERNPGAVSRFLEGRKGDSVEERKDLKGPRRRFFANRIRKA